MNRKKKEFAVALALLSASSALCLRIMKRWMRSCAARRKSGRGSDVGKT